ncbi:MAG: hypothetical protein IT429_03835 [Gemmataceae bacterium]|nr:hypothetical protein [Gemmataceae bacterium]
MRRRAVPLTISVVLGLIATGLDWQRSDAQSGRGVSQRTLTFKPIDTSKALARNRAAAGSFRSPQPVRPLGNLTQFFRYQPKLSNPKGPAPALTSPAAQPLAPQQRPVVGKGLFGLPFGLLK